MFTPIIKKEEVTAVKSAVASGVNMIDEFGIANVEPSFNEVIEQPVRKVSNNLGGASMLRKANEEATSNSTNP